MKGPDLGALTKALAKNKYVLLVLCVGLGLMLLPRRTSETALSTAGSAAADTGARGNPLAASGIPLDTECGRIAALLRAIRGVGEAEVLLSANGCVVACTGADSPEVRLDVTNAVAAYTGLGSDKIWIVKMNSGGSEK